MQTKQTVLFIYTETALHAGTGTGLGAVDLPIQREKHTDYPIIQASGVKGALRNTAELVWKDNPQQIRDIFGAASGDPGEDFAGAVSPSDARILLFPVRALNGVFLWVTSPTALDRFQRDARLGNSGLPIPEPRLQQALVSDDLLRIGGRIMLEEYTYDAQIDPSVSQWADFLASNALPVNGYDYWKSRMRTHLVVLTDNEFRDFVKYATDIVTRIHIDDTTKTVKDGQLFTQELLPADSLMYSVLHLTDSRNERKSVDQVLADLRLAVGTAIQIGADETVGRGRVRLTWQEVQ